MNQSRSRVPMLDFYYAERHGYRKFPIEIELNDPRIENRLKAFAEPSRYLSMRRAFEIGIIIALSPVVIPICLIVALCIIIDSPGPAFYWQYRPGRNGRMFRVFKFRSMRMRRRAGAWLTRTNDDRITRVGRFIRV